MQKHLRKLGLALSISFLALAGSFYQPQLHNSYLRWEVGESVVQVLHPVKFGGGTGFAVKGKSGAEYIMTNRHVCAVAVNDMVAIKQDDGEKVLKRVLYRDKKHDLCLIEGDDRFSALEIGDYPDKGDLHYVVGHPGLRQLTIAQGEFIGPDIIEMPDFSITKRNECNGKIVELPPFFQMMFGIEFACFISYDTYATSATIYGGNSGSPIVDAFGNVIGVVFAGSSEQEKDNHAVPLYHVKRVLSKF